jgi:hypothetical protein
VETGTGAEVGSSVQTAIHTSGDATQAAAAGGADGENEGGGEEDEEGDGGGMTLRTASRRFGRQFRPLAAAATGSRATSGLSSRSGKKPKKFDNLRGRGGIFQSEFCELDKLPLLLEVSKVNHVFHTCTVYAVQTYRHLLIVVQNSEYEQY